MDSNMFGLNSSSSSARSALSNATTPLLQQPDDQQQQQPQPLHVPLSLPHRHHHHHHHHHDPQPQPQNLSQSQHEELSTPPPQLLGGAVSSSSGNAAAEQPMSSAQLQQQSSSSSSSLIHTQASHGGGDRMSVSESPAPARSASSSLIGGDSFASKKLRLEIKAEPLTPPNHQQPSPSDSPTPISVAGSATGSHSHSSQAINSDLQSWQESKRTIKDRTGCLVNSERLSDVTFLVGQNETPIYGHKTILSVGSPYFEKLFFGPMAEKKTQIKIPDIEPEIFLTFLKYLYTDEFDSSMDDSDTLMLLKPAKVYIVPHLAEKCTALLVERMNPENVLVIYNRALIFDEPKLADFCMRFVDRQIDKIVSTENFLHMEPEILCTILDRDNLRIDECSLFKAVVKWTETECSRQNLEFNSANSRAVLGRALYMLRFPTMGKEEFCIEVVPTNILDKDEIIGIFMNLCIGNEMRYYRPETPFSINKRVFRPKLHYLSRFADVLSKVWSISNGFGSTTDMLYSSKLRFQVDQRIFIHGVGVYGFASPIPTIRFNATASICKAQNLLSCRTLDGSARSYDFRMPFQVMFEKPIEVLPDEEYLLTSALKIVRDSLPNSNSNIFGTFGTSSHYGSTVNIDAYYGTKAHSQVKISCTDGVTVNFTFHVPSCYHIGETFPLGQIPQIIFSV